jgi:signal transduction histidine kinase
MKKEDTLAPTAIPRAFRRRKQLEQDLDHVTEEMYRRNKELAETNQMLSLLRQIDSVVLQSQDSLKQVCEQIAEAITASTDYPAIGIFTRPSMTHRELALYGWSVKGQAVPEDTYGLKRAPQVLLDDEIWQTSDTGVQHLSIEHYTTADVAHFFGCSHAVAEALREHLPLKSIYAVKLVARDRVVGLMVAGFFGDVAQISISERSLLERLSESVGIAIDNRLLFEENRRVLLQLQRSNVKLKALDETKDDFISMASHQLRTPLTSVKGYLSMVLEGDAGKINDTERKMLGQAYISSQRMVYLIADLLNVSRLKTGKFIIDAAPTDLSKIIDEEIDQLVEAAAARSLTLIYEPPKHFPVLMLDETKIRQVIMNFIDNAIYYTPDGGKIRIELHDTGPMVELRVVDNGIGVPKTEQHHLFTKFYRAGNARKARPDGTGLGLFMAKKVITAQGGALLFDSKEGKGSTFGFTFSKSKLAAPIAAPTTTAKVATKSATAATKAVPAKR